MKREFQLKVNGEAVRVITEESRPLLDVLREDLGLTGTKYGCGEGECGACTVLIGDEPVRSCITSVAETGGEAIRTVEGCIIMGLGGALYEEIRFKNGAVTNASFSQYRVPRMDDVPELDIVLLERRDLPSVGAGETPIIAVAPAVANAVLHATGVRIRSLPLRMVERQKSS